METRSGGYVVVRVTRSASLRQTRHAPYADHDMCARASEWREASAESEGDHERSPRFRHWAFPAFPKSSEKSCEKRKPLFVAFDARAQHTRGASFALHVASLSFAVALRVRQLSRAS